MFDKLQWHVKSTDTIHKKWKIGQNPKKKQLNKTHIKHTHSEKETHKSQI